MEILNEPDKLRTLVKYALGTTILLNTGVSILMLFLKLFPTAGMFYLIIAYTIAFLFLPSLIAVIFIGIKNYQKRENLRIGLKEEKKYIIGVIGSIGLYFICLFIGLWFSGNL